MRKLLWKAYAAAAAFLLLPGLSAQAGLTMLMQLTRGTFFQSGFYYAYVPYLNTNGNPPAVPFGDYCVAAPGYSTNPAAGATLYHYDTNGFNQIGYGGSYAFFDFDSPNFSDSFIQNITNGEWSLFVTNDVTTNTYYFTVTADLDSNSIPGIIVTCPAYGATNVTTEPTFSWADGPTNYDDLVVYQGFYGDFLPVTQTNWSDPVLVPSSEPVSFTAHYDLFPTNAVFSSVPLDTKGDPISSWVSTAQIEDFGSSQFTVGAADTSGTGHTLMAHYPWDQQNGDGTASGVDVSGNGYNMNFSGSFGLEGGEVWTTRAAVGPGAIRFEDGDGNSGGFAGWNSTPAALLTTLAGSFTISCWLETKQNFDFNGDVADHGAGIVSADVPGVANDVIPLALTGSQVAFNTGGDADDTLNSNASINDGNFHHVVVTRNQLTGQKIIYVDGIFDSFDTGSTNLLDDPQKLTIGALADASDPNVADPNDYNGFNGFLDDLQIYYGVLSAGEVADLFNNPGTSIANKTGIILTHAIFLPGGVFQFGFQCLPGSSNTVYSATDLRLPLIHWTVLGHATEISSGHFQFKDTQARNSARQFYRVSSP